MQKQVIHNLALISCLFLHDKTKQIIKPLATLIVRLRGTVVTRWIILIWALGSNPGGVTSFFSYVMAISFLTSQAICHDTDTLPQALCA